MQLYKTTPQVASYYLPFKNQKEKRMHWGKSRTNLIQQRFMSKFQKSNFAGHVSKLFNPEQISWTSILYIKDFSLEKQKDGLLISIFFSYILGMKRQMVSIDICFIHITGMVITCLSLHVIKPIFVILSFICIHNMLFPWTSFA